MARWRCASSPTGGAWRGDNPFESWIAAYAGEDYQRLARGAAARIDALGRSHGGEARFALLAPVFAEAARLEARFWQQGLDAAAAAGA